MQKSVCDERWYLQSALHGQAWHILSLSFCCSGGWCGRMQRALLQASASAAHGGAVFTGLSSSICLSRPAAIPLPPQFPAAPNTGAAAVRRLDLPKHAQQPGKLLLLGLSLEGRLQARCFHPWAETVNAVLGLLGAHLTLACMFAHSKACD